MSTEGDQADFTPDDIRALKADIPRHRSVPTPFGTVVGGRRRGDDWEAERALPASLADAGATRWTEYLTVDFGSLDQIRERICTGPLRPL